MNLISVYELNNNTDKAALLQKLHKWNLIPKEGEYMCQDCNFPLRLGNASDRFVKHRLNVYGHSSRCKNKSMVQNRWIFCYFDKNAILR